MQKTTLSAIALSLFASPTLAGSPEAIVEVAPVIVAATDWSGVYVGGMYESYTADMYTIETGAVVGGGGYNGVGTETTFGVEARNIGLYAGKNWQRNALVYGLEGSFSTSNILATSVLSGSFDTFGVYDGQFVGKLSARVGIAQGPFLIYGVAGLAALNGTFGVLDDNPLGATVDTRTNMTLTGLSYGGGVEFLTASSWSIRVEYSAVDFGEFSTIGTVPGGGDSGWDHSIVAETVTVGVAKHF